jgi:MerC mercury resistance protein
MKERIRKINWDALGITTSIACAIHCALLPLFLTSLPLFGVNIIHNVFFEAGMILLAFCIGAYSLYHGYSRHHHSKLPLVLFSLGMALLVIKQFFIAWETWLLIPAVILIVSAHVVNYSSCRVHNHAHSDDCNH